MSAELFVIAGPTASGKSQYALDLANKVGGEIINADAIQVYQEIPILSCAPSIADTKSITHHLYNYISVTDDYSVGKYIQDAVTAINNVTSSGKVPILVGGTGMYIKSLCYGIHDIPEITAEIRANTRSKFQELGNEKFYDELRQLDPIGAAQIHQSNSQRVIRYYEIFMQTGHSIVEFYKDKPQSFLQNYDIKTIILEPERKMLYDRCDKRFIAVLDNALEEVAYVCSLYDEYTAAEKAIGFNELKAYLANTISKDEAIALAQARTRQYAKRQMTWFRHQIDDAIRIEFDNILPSIDHILGATK